MLDKYTMEINFINMKNYNHLNKNL